MGVDVTAGDTSATGEIGVALVGASTIAAEFMLPALAATDGIRITGVFSTNPERGRAFADRHDVPRVYSSLDETLRDREVAAVYISTAHALHADQAERAMAASKHVLCEKPIALDTRQAVRLMMEADEAGVIFATDHHFRNAPGIRVARETVARGTLGTPIGVSVRQVIDQPPQLRERRLDPGDPGAGIIWDMTVHSADATSYVLADDIAKVAAFASDRAGAGGPEDSVMGVFETRAGVPISFFDSFNSGHAGSALEVHGSEGSLFVTDALDELKAPRVWRAVGGVSEPVDCGGLVDVYGEGVARFRDAIRGDGRPVADARDGAHSVAVAEATRAAVSSGATAPVTELPARPDGS